MVKKLSYLLIIAIILQVTLIACCSDTIWHTRLTEFKTTMVDRLGVDYPDSMVLELDSVFIEIATTAERIASNLLFIENTYATQPCDHYEQLKNEIVSIEVISDKILFGLSAGSHLNMFVGKFVSGKMENIDYWVWQMNNHFRGELKQSFVFLENPNSDEYFKLNIKLNFQDGSHMVAETQYVRVK